MMAMQIQARLSNHHFGAFLRLQKPSLIARMLAEGLKLRHSAGGLRPQFRG
jgi:hypothetical protein